MWYTPQHTTSFALGLVAVIVSIRLAGRARPLAYFLTGVALGLSVTMNPLLGAAFCAIYGATVVFDVVTRRLPPVALLQQTLTIAPVLLGLWWCFASGMGDTAGSHLSVGWLFDARNSPVLTLFLSLGAWRLSRAHLLTRRIPAIETLGATTVLCVDKTAPSP